MRATGEQPSVEQMLELGGREGGGKVDDDSEEKG